jgi:hypothetical protein
MQAPEERKRIKLLLAAQEQLFPDVHGNLLQARADFRRCAARWS